MTFELPTVRTSEMHILERQGAMTQLSISTSSAQPRHPEIMGESVSRVQQVLSPTVMTFPIMTRTPGELSVGITDVRSDSDLLVNGAGDLERCDIYGPESQS